MFNKLICKEATLTLQNKQAEMNGHILEKHGVKVVKTKKMIAWSCKLCENIQKCANFDTIKDLQNHVGRDYFIDDLLQYLLEHKENNSSCQFCSDLDALPKQNGNDATYVWYPFSISVYNNKSLFYIAHPEDEDLQIYNPQAK